MGVLDEFSIPIFGLKNKEYQYDFEVDYSLFVHNENKLVSNSNIKVDVKLIKTETMIQLFFEINGCIELECDRSLELFDFPINLKHKLFLKFGEEDEYINDELEVISNNKDRINISQYIYEYISLAIPLKKLHPKFKDSEIGEELTLVYSSVTEEQEDAYLEEEKPKDSRWSALEKLGFKKNKIS